MPTTNNEQWQRYFNKLVQDHHIHKLKVKKLVYQLNGLMDKHRAESTNMALEAKKYMEKIKAINDIREKLNSLLRSKKGKLKPQEVERIRRLRMKLPEDTLYNRVRLLELFEQLHNFYENQLPKEHFLRYWHGRSARRMAKHQSELKDIEQKTQRVFNDIKHLASLIKRVSRRRTSLFKIQPFLVRNWLERKQDLDVKATISMTSKKTYRTWDVRSNYILRHIPEMMPRTYGYLRC